MVPPLPSLTVPLIWDVDWAHELEEITKSDKINRTQVFIKTSPQGKRNVLKHHGSPNTYITFCTGKRVVLH